MRTRVGLVVGLAALLSACTIDAPTFFEGDGGVAADARPDARPDGGVSPDAPDGGVPLLILTTPSSVEVDEAGEVTFEVTLSRAPEAAVTVTVAAADEDLLGVSPSSLVFEPSTFDAPQTVTVAAFPDDDATVDAVDVVLSALGAEADVSVEVTISDDDTVGLDVSPGAQVDVGEGESAVVQVRLTAQPASAVTVAAMSGSTGVATVSPPSLVFDETNWSTVQVLNVAGVEDADTLADTTTLTISATGLSPVVLDVDVADDDVLGIAVSTTNLGTIAEGTGGSFAVSLTQQPPGPVTVAVGSSTGALTVNPTSVSFDTTNWDDPQTVTVSAPHDVDVGDATVTITLSATGMTSRTVAALVDDDDVQAIIVNPASLSLDEGSTGTFTVRLAYAPTEPMAVSVSSLNTSVATSNFGQINFDAGNYATPRTVTVTAVHDQNLASGSTSIRAQNVTQGLQADVGISVADDDVQIVQLQDLTTGPMLEGAGGRLIGVRLGFQPLASTVVTVTSTDAARLPVDPGSRTFTTANWNEYQYVGVSALDDDDLVDNTVQVSGAAPDSSTATLTLTIDDDDTQQVIVSAADTMLEEGESAVAMVSLAFRPESVTNVTAMSSEPAHLEVESPIAFTSSNWNVPRTVTILAYQDDDATDHYSVGVSFAVANGNGAELHFDVNDDDTLQPVFTQSHITVYERAPQVASVRLSHRIYEDMTVMVYTNNASYATAMPATLTFTPGNWSAAQTVTITPVDDDDDVSEEFELVAWDPETGLWGTVGGTIHDGTHFTGFSAPLPDPDSGVAQADTVYAFQVTQADEMSLEKFVAEVYFAPDAEIQLGLYTDDAGRPGGRFRWSNPFPAAAYSRAEAVAANGGTVWAGDTYWIAVHVKNGMAFKSSPSTPAIRCEAAAPWTAGMPTTFPPGAICGSNPAWQIFAVGWASPF